MRLEAFDYELPRGLVAQEPAPRRDGARLLVLDRGADGLEETTFESIDAHLHPGDLLVVNDTRVIPARLRARKPTGGEIELLLVERLPDPGEGQLWVCLVSTGRGLRPGGRLKIASGFEAEIVAGGDGPRWTVRLLAHGDVEEALAAHGRMPLPPYIHREVDRDDERDAERYQTVYARSAGAIAAPTAGLHFTRALMDRMERRGFAFAGLTLHVGPGTFQPVRSVEIEDHRLEAERFLLPRSTAEAIDACRARRGRVVAVGTTVTRVLEARALDDGRVEAGEGRCDLYITPGHRFRAVDALITNFHLPRTTLLMLVSAFAGRERILAAYREAVARRMRFYSYGDAMLIR